MIKKMNNGAQETQPKSFTFYVLGLFAVATFGIWIYGWVAQASNNQLDLRTGEQRTAAPDLFDDSTLAIRAETICNRAANQIEQLQSSTLINSPEERSVEVATGTNIYRSMLNELNQLEPATERDEVIFFGWLEDWETHMEDRQYFTESLAAGEDSQFIMSARPGERIDKIVTRVATTNEMVSCSFPTDVG